MPPDMKGRVKVSTWKGSAALTDLLVYAPSVYFSNAVDSSLWSLRGPHSSSSFGYLELEQHHSDPMFSGLIEIQLKRRSSKLPRFLFLLFAAQGCSNLVCTAVL